MSARRSSLLGFLVVTVASLLLAACGGQSEPSSEQRGSGGSPAAAWATTRAAEPSRPVPRNGSDAKPDYRSLVDNQRRRSQGRFSPCDLVKASEAQAILGEAILEPYEAPQGPTCVVRTRSRAKFVTLAVQTAGIAQLKRQLHRVRRTTIGARRAYCGVLGHPLLYVPLRRQRVLMIAAPCRTARRFASAAFALMACTATARSSARSSGRAGSTRSNRRRGPRSRPAIACERRAALLPKDYGARR